MKGAITAKIMMVMTVIIGVVGLVYTVITLYRGSWTGIAGTALTFIVWPELALTFCRIAEHLDERPR